MSRPTAPICVPCGRMYKPDNNAGAVELMTGRGYYELYLADILRCPGCDHRIVSGFGFEPIITYLESNYEKVAGEVKRSYETIFVRED